MEISQIEFAETGGPEVLRLVRHTLPEPGPDELQIEVHAAGINFADILARQGLYPDAPPLPAVVGYEVSGVVRAQGASVDGDRVGREVVALTRFGGYSTAINVDAAQARDKPATLTHAQAVAIPVSYLTAWQLVYVQGGLRAGETILIQNAGSGVGLAALDVARHIGARTIGTASARKHALLAERGLDHAVDPRAGDSVATVRTLTGGHGVELAIDPLGGESARRSRSLLRPTGRLGIYGVAAASGGGGGGAIGKLRLMKTAAAMPLGHPISLMNSNTGIFGVNIGRMWHERDMIGSWLERILTGIDEGWVRPHLDSTAPFSDAGAAHARIEARETTGKVALIPDDLAGGGEGA